MGKDALTSLYSIMRVAENQVGGGEGVEGIYGTITKTGTSTIMNCLADKCGMGSDSILVDIGAGLARPCLHALVEPGVGGAFGIEIDAVKCHKAEAFVSRVRARFDTRPEASVVGVPKVGRAAGNLPIKQTAIEELPTLEPATHAYSFWEGVPEKAKCAFGHLFSLSSTLRGVAVVQRAWRGGCDPAQQMFQRGFGVLRLEGAFPVSMSGSGRNMTAYVFARSGAAPVPRPLFPMGGKAVQGKKAEEKDLVVVPSEAQGALLPLKAELGRAVGLFGARARKPARAVGKFTASPVKRGEGAGPPVSPVRGSGLGGAKRSLFGGEGAPAPKRAHT